jgi:peptide/nickel transport system substrate-binding protein
VTPHVWNYHLSQAEGSPWRDVRLRRAANLAINRDEVVALMNGLAKPASAWWTPPRPGSAARVPRPHRHGRGAAPPRRGRLRPRNPLRTRFLVPNGGSGQMASMPINEYIQASWREVGIQVEFQVVELEVLYTCWRQGALGEIARNGNIPPTTSPT